MLFKIIFWIIEDNRDFISIVQNKDERKELNDEISQEIEADEAIASTEAS